MYTVYTEYLPLRPKFSSILLYNQLFWRYKVVENQKCTKWPQTDLEHLTVKSILYALNTYTRSPNFHPFCCTTNHYRDTRLQKIRNALNDLRMALKPNFKSTLYTLVSYPRGTKFYPFHSTTSRLQDTRLSKIRNAPNYFRLTLNTKDSFST